MAKPLASASQWAQRYIVDERTGETILDPEIIEGQAVDTTPSIDYGHALQLQAGGLVQIIVGAALATVGFGLFPLGVLTVPLGGWLIYRGIVQARDSLITASRTHTGKRAG